MFAHCYHVLELYDDASLPEIEASYNRLVAKYANNPAAKQELNDAYFKLIEYQINLAEYLTGDEDSDDQREILHDLPVSFEELFRGCNKKLTVQIHDPVDGTSQNELISIKIKPGMAPEMRIPFPLLASSERIRENMFFVIKDKANQRFKRLNDTDIEFTAYITSHEQRNGSEMLIPTLENDPISLCYEDEIGMPEEEFFGRGLPTFGNKKHRGKLVVRFVVSDDPEMKNQQRELLYEKFGNDMNEVIVVERLTKAQEVNPDISKTQSLKGDGDSFKDIEYIDGDEIADETEQEKTLGGFETAKFEPNNGVKKSQEQLPANHYDIKLSLEEIYRGTVKKQEIVSQYTNSFGRVKHLTKTLKITIKPGSIDGTQIVHEFEGDEAYQKIAADVIFTIREEPHGTFQRIGNDIEYCAKITSREAYHGGNLKIPTLDGSLVGYAIKTPVQSGNRQKIEGRGLPIIDRGGKFGDLWVKFDIIFDMLAFFELLTTEIINFLNLENEIVDPPITHDLNVSLEQILTGCTRRLKINRLILDRYGNAEEKVEILPITVKPGTKEGTAYTYPRYGDQAIGHIPADIIFKLKYKPHENFKVYGHDLLYKTSVFQSQVSFIVPTLKDGPKEICLENVDVKNNRKKISGQGLPKNENADERGDLIVKFEIMDDPKDEPVPYELEVTLEDILTGCLKKMKIKRKMFDSHGNEKSMKAEVIPIQVVPGTPNGHQFTFPKLGDVHPGRTPADIVFTVCYKDHPFFDVKGNDIYYSTKLTNLEAVKCIPISVPTLSGEMYTIKRKSSVFGEVETLLGQGLPIFANPGKRGKLYVRFNFYSGKFKDEPIHEDLVLTLEEMYYGCVKKKKIIQKVVDKYGNDLANNYSTNEEMVEFNIHPGTQAGKRFTCYRLGDYSVNRIPADIIFTTAQAEHPIFARWGFNLHYTAKITKSEVQNGCQLKVPTLEGENRELNIKAKSFKPDSMREFRNLGFLNPETTKRGCLIVDFNVIDDPIELQNMSPKESSMAKKSKSEEQSEIPSVIEEKEDSPKNQSAELPQDEAIVYDLRLNLEDILHGVDKRMRIIRRVTAENGDKVDREEIITINVKPGTEAGTRFVIEKTGDQNRASLPADIVFVAVYVPHQLFTRQGKDIHYRATISPNQIANGYDLQIPTLNEGTLTLPVKKDSNISVPYSIPGYGLPGTEEWQSRGNLVVHFVVGSDQELVQKMDYEIVPQPALPIQDPATVIDLPLSLEDILNGYKTIVQLKRHTYDENGDIIWRESVPFRIEIHPGTPVDFPVIFPNHGHIKPGMQPADVVFLASEIHHKFFRRNGADIECTVPITYQQAIEGGTITVPTLKGFKIEVNLPSPIGPDSIERIPELGLPYADLPSKRGSLVVHFDIAEEKNQTTQAFKKVVKLFDFVTNDQI